MTHDSLCPYVSPYVSLFDAPDRKRRVWSFHGIARVRAQATGHSQLIKNQQEEQR